MQLRRRCAIRRSVSRSRFPRRNHCAARARQSHARFRRARRQSRWCASAFRTMGRCATGCPPNISFDPVACGGGAMIDLGAHGMYLSRWLLGTPRRCNVDLQFGDRPRGSKTTPSASSNSRTMRLPSTRHRSSVGAALTASRSTGSRGGFQMSSPRNVRTRSGDDKAWRPAELPRDEAMPIPRWIASIDGSGSRPVRNGLSRRKPSSFPK